MQRVTGMGAPLRTPGLGAANANLRRTSTGKVSKNNNPVHVQELKKAKARARARARAEDEAQAQVDRARARARARAQAGAPARTSAQAEASRAAVEHVKPSLCYFIQPGHERFVHQSLRCKRCDCCKKKYGCCRRSIIPCPSNDPTQTARMQHSEFIVEDVKVDQTDFDRY